MPRIAILEDDPLVGRRTAELVADGLAHDTALATAPAQQAAALDGAAAVIVGATFGGRPLAATVAAVRAQDPRRPVLVVCEVHGDLTISVALRASRSAAA